MYQTSIYFNDKIQVIPSGSKKWTARKTIKKALYIKQQDRFSLNINQIQLLSFYQKRESYFNIQLFVDHNIFYVVKVNTVKSCSCFVKSFIEFTITNSFQSNNTLAVLNTSSIITSIENQFYNNRSIYLSSRFTSIFFQQVGYHQLQSLYIYSIQSITGSNKVSISKQYIDKGLSFFLPSIFGFSGSYFDFFNQSNWHIRYVYARKLVALSKYEITFNPYTERDFNFFIKLYARKQSYKLINSTCVGIFSQIASLSKFFRFVSWVKGKNLISIGSKGKLKYDFNKKLVFTKIKKIIKKVQFNSFNIKSQQQPIFKKKIYLNKKYKKKFPALFLRLQNSGFSFLDRSKSNYFTEYYNTIKKITKSAEHGLTLVNKNESRRFNRYLRFSVKKTKNKARLRKYILNTNNYKAISNNDFQKNIGKLGRIYQVNQINTLSRLRKKKEFLDGFKVNIPFGSNLFFRQKAIKTNSIYNKTSKSFKNYKFAEVSTKKIFRFKNSNLKSLKTLSKKKSIYSFSRGFYPMTKRLFFSVQGQIAGLFNKRIYRKITPQTFGIKLKGNTSNIGVFSRRRFNQLKNLVLRRTDTRRSLYRINGISFTRFIFNKESLTKLLKWHSSVVSSNNQPEISIIRKVINELSQAGPFNKNVKTSSAFLRSIERERVSRFRYVAVYIQDLIRVTFFAIYIKKASFLASFFAFTLGKLPRNRKETTFLRFLIKLLKVFSSQRKEMLGVRIRFQGRVNRWRRTKHILGEKGVIPFYTYRSRMDYGSAQAITRKGAQGIKIWLCYQSYFSTDLKKAIYSYMSIPKLLVTENKDFYAINQQPFKQLQNNNKQKITIFKYQQQFNNKVRF